MIDRELIALQMMLDANDLPDDWPPDVCRDAWCGVWERNGGRRYYWHRITDERHDFGDATLNAFEQQFDPAHPELGWTPSEPLPFTPEPPLWRWWVHNLIAHPLLVVCPPLGRCLHDRTEPKESES